jgi:hypothetical protein
MRAFFTSLKRPVLGAAFGVLLGLFFLGSRLRPPTRSS